MTCHVCKARNATRLCDFPIAVDTSGDMVTCDALLCDGCTHEMWCSHPAGMDRCPWHAYPEEWHDLRRRLSADDIEAIRERIRGLIAKPRPKTIEAAP